MELFCGISLYCYDHAVLVTWAYMYNLKSVTRYQNQRPEMLCVFLLGKNGILKMNVRKKIEMQKEVIEKQSGYLPASLPVVDRSQTRCSKPIDLSRHDYVP